MMAVNWTTWKGEEAWDGKSYEEYERSQGNIIYTTSPNNEYVQALIKNGFNIEWPYNDFYSDGLRFATYNEFS